MSYEPEADANKGLFSGMPGKKMALLVPEACRIVRLR